MKYAVFVLGFVFVLLISGSVTAFSISPGLTEVFFEPAKKFNVSFTINNYDENANFWVEPYIENADFRTEMTNNIITPGRVFVNIKSLKVMQTEITLPNTLEPGTYEIKLNVNYDTAEDEGKETLVARATEYYLVKIIVPYREKFLRARVEEVVDKNSDTHVIFKISGQSLSTKNIEDAKAFVKIYSSGNLTDELISETQKISPRETKFYELFLNASNYSIGYYDFETGILYDGLIARAHGDKFLKGDLDMEIGNLSSNVIKKGVINKLKLGLTNKWNKRIDGIYADVVLYSGIDELVKFRSETIGLDAWQRGELPIFIDAGDLEEGDYIVNTIVNFRDLTKSKEHRISVSDKISLPSGFAGNGAGVTFMLIVVVILFIIINIILFVKLRKMKEKK